MTKQIKPLYGEGDEMKTVVGASDKFYHTKRKGSKGKILKVGNAGGICYYINFITHQEWYYENELILIKKHIMNRKFNNTPNPMIEVNGKEIYLSRSSAVATIVLLNNTLDNKTYVLLGKRGIGCPDFVGHWNAPCGYLDYDENLSEAVIREIYEETGFEVDEYCDQIDCRVLRSDMEQPWYTHSTPVGNKQNVTSRYGILFESDILPLLTFENSEPDEVSELKWVCVDDLDDYSFAFNHKTIIREYISRSSINFNVKKATVFLSNGTDTITIYPDIVSSFPNMGYEPSFKMDTQRGYGVEYCKTVLGINPQVIDARI